MKSKLSVLIVEDSEDDALLILHHIEKAGYEIESERIETAEAMKSALHERTWDIILADYKMPSFNGLEAIKVRNEFDVDLPLIVISGTIGEAIAVEVIKAGAQDYLMKDNLLRLVPTIERELRESKAKVKRRWLEKERIRKEKTHLHLLRSLDQINRVIQGANDLQQMMSDLMDAVLSIFDCDRAFLLYPLDLESDTWSIPMERTKPEFPGALALGVDEIPMDEGVLQTFRKLLNHDGPVKFDKETGNPLPAEAADRFGFKSFISMAIRPKVGKPWSFGLHQCSYDRVWTPEEETLFEAIGRRLGDGLSILLAYQNLQASEERLRKSNRNKSILASIADVFLTVPDDEMYGEVLDIIRKAFESPLGIFGFINESGDLILPSLTREAWNECRIPDKSIVFPKDTWGDSLWGRAVNEKRMFHSSGPFNTPHGHIKIKTFISSPIVFAQKSIGNISLANKPGGYLPEDEELLEQISSFISPILNARLQRDAQEQQRKEAEDALRESEKKYRLLVSNAGEGVLIVQDGQIKFPNPKAVEMTGYDSQELTRMAFMDLVDQQDKEIVYEKYFSRMEIGKAPLPYPFRLVSKMEEHFWVQLSATHTTWENRSGILCFIRDITEEKNLEAKFLQAQKMEAVGRFVGGIAHDFNNLLTGITLNIEMMLMDLPENDPLHESLSEINVSAMSSANLIRQLLAFSRKQVIEPYVIDLNTLINDIRRMLKRLIGEDIKLHFIPQDKLGHVKVDPGQFEQVIVNLAVNARDAMPDGGDLTIQTANTFLDEAFCKSYPEEVHAGDYVRLSFSDTGSGMSEEVLQHIFEPFFTTKSTEKGTGLGLATVFGIVKQAGGIIAVNSKTGRGTTFDIYLQRVEEIAQTVAKTSAVKKMPSGNETVFLVEDEPLVRFVTERLLKKLGYKVRTFPNGGEAIMKAKEFKDDIHLLMTDVVLPGVNGLIVAKELLSIKPKTKILYISGYVDNEIVQNEVLAKGHHFIAKPYSQLNIAQKIRNVLDDK